MKISNSLKELLVQNHTLIAMLGMYCASNLLLQSEQLGKHLNQKVKLPRKAKAALGRGPGAGSMTRGVSGAGNSGPGAGYSGPGVGIPNPAPD